MTLKLMPPAQRLRARPEAGTVTDGSELISEQVARPRSLKPGFALKLGLLALVSLGCLGLLELSVRILRPQPSSWLSIYRHHPRLPFFSMMPDASALVDTGETRWTVRTDHSGFRVPNEPRANDARPVALLLGDSFAFGQGVNFEESFAGRLDADPKGRFHVVDTAVGGHGPLQYSATLDDLIDRGHRPSVVVVASFLGNDFHDTIWNKDLPIAEGVAGNDGGVAAFFKTRFHLYRLATKVYHRASGQDLRADDDRGEMGLPQAWRSGFLADADRKYRRAMQQIVTHATDIGAKVVVVIIPWGGLVDAVRREGMPRGPNVAGPRLALVRAHAALDPLGVPVVDVTQGLTAYPTAETYFRFDGHFTPTGHRIVADALAHALSTLE